MRALAILLLLAPLAFAKKPHCTVRLHAEGNARDTEVFSSSIRSPLTGKEIAIQKIPTISEQDVVAFRPYPLANGTFGALLVLDEHGKLALDTLSLERRGSLVFIFVNGRPVSEMQIDRRISDGKIYLSAGLTSADIAAMQKDWRLIAPRKK